MDCSVKYGLLMTLFFHYLVVARCTTTIDENTDLQDYSEAPLGLNLEPQRPEDKTELFSVSQEWPPEPSVFQWTKKPIELRREAESLPRMLTSSYESNFDRRYELRYHYSEIFEDPGRDTLVKPARRLYLANYNFASFPSLIEVAHFIYEFYLESIFKNG